MHFLHRLAHLFGLQEGQIYTWREYTGRFMIGFRCVTCGDICGAHSPNEERLYEEAMKDEAA